MDNIVGSGWIDNIWVPIVHILVAPDVKDSNSSLLGSRRKTQTGLAASVHTHTSQLFGPKTYVQFWVTMVKLGFVV